MKTPSDPVANGMSSDELIEVTKEMRAHLKSLRRAADATDPFLWFYCVLHETIGTVTDAASLATNDSTTGLKELSRVLHAVMRSVLLENDLSNLLTERKGGTMLSIANGYLSDSGSPIGAKQSVVVRQIAEWFHPEPKELGPMIEPMLALLAAPGIRMMLGEPQADWKGEIVRQCEKVQRKPKALNREPVDYLRAVLRGWGFSESDARDAAKPARDVGN